MSSVFARRALLRPNMVVRNFSSSLLVPLQAKMDIPAELENRNISEYAYSQQLEKYAAFNEQCKSELQEMNKNIIENIVARGGTEGWETDMYAMKKDFEFDSFEECHAFCTRVAKDAEAKDHHPEWKLTNSGKTVSVKLTSHFAENTVTRLDFELAEAMNNAFTETRGTFKMFPRFTEGEWASIKIGVGLFVLTSFFFKFVTGYPYEQKEIAAAPLPSTHFENPAGKYSPVQALADKSSKVGALDYAYGEYESREATRPFPGV